MNKRTITSGSGTTGIRVNNTLHSEDYDGWQLLSYDTDPETGFLIRDPKQSKRRLEILYWQQNREQNETQFVVEAETGNVGIGATSPSDKLTLRGGGLAFQQAGQDRSEMGIDYDAGSQSLRIRARRGEATAIGDAVLTITKDGQLTAGAVRANSLQANGANQSLTIASAGTGALLLNPAGGKVSIGTTPQDASLEVNGAVKASGEITAERKITAKGGLEVTGNLTANGEITAAGKITATGGLEIAASKEIRLDSTKLTADGVSGKTLTATDEIRASKVQGTGTNSSLMLLARQGVLTLQGARVILGSEIGKEITVLNDLVMDANRKILLKGSDENHGIRNGLSVFAVDGPLIFGDGGGVLGSRFLLNRTLTQVMGLAWTQKGDVGIGTTAPGGMLEIKSRDPNNADAVIKFGGKNGDVHHLSSARDMVFNSIKGEFYFRKLSDFDDLLSFASLPRDPITGSLMYIGSNGNVRIKGTLSQSCSREFKENISELTSDEAMAALRDLNPVKYDYKGARAFRQNLGFIAEDMPADLASEDRKSISPFEVIPVLTRVAKEQQQAIALLQETIRALQTKVEQSGQHAAEGPI